MDRNLDGPYLRMTDRSAETARGMGSMHDRQLGIAVLDTSALRSEAEVRAQRAAKAKGTDDCDCTVCSGQEG